MYGCIPLNVNVCLPIIEFATKTLVGYTQQDWRRGPPTTSGDTIPPHSVAHEGHNIITMMNMVDNDECYYVGSGLSVGNQIIIFIV